MFSSPGLSLALQMNKNDELSRMIGDLDSVVRTHKEELENDISKSGSDHLDGASGDDLELENPRKRKKRYHRHTPRQIQELETLFKECPHPDEKQRNELSKRLSLDPRQVKFWFQNRRTQMKSQLERHENSLLRQENERLKYEHMTIRDAIRNPTCNSCGGCAILGELSFEQQHLKIENARLKDELDRVCSLAGKFLGQSVTTMPPSSLPNSSLELTVRSNGFCSLDYFNNNTMSSSIGTNMTPPYKAMSNFGSVDDTIEKSVLLELASSAINELVKMAQLHEPLWVPSFDGGKEILNYEEYLLAFPRCIGSKPIEYVSEATRSTGMVILNSFTLVETLMDATRWANMFPSMIARATTTDIISRGVGGTRNGALQLMQAELQVLSPLVPTREINFLRFCKQIAEGVWAVVDVSCDAIRENFSGNLKCRRLPSGCLVQDMPNGYSQVTWVEHTEYDETAVHQLYRSVLRSGIALGAHRWVSTLKGRCECLAILMSTSFPTTDTTVTPTGRKSMLKLSQRMMDNFCSGICPSSARKWTQLTVGNIGKDVRVMTRQNLDDPGEPPGVVISAAMSVWLPVLPGRLFDFLKNAGLRSEWDILSNGEPMLEMTHIAKGQDEGSAVSLLRTSATNGSQGNNMLILQETCTDASNSMVVYAPVDIPAMHIVMNGGDSTCVALLPSGFSILPDSAGGSLLTVGFQILVNTLPSAKLTMESVETVSNLISCTIQKIKGALHVVEG